MVRFVPPVIEPNFGSITPIQSFSLPLRAAGIKRVGVYLLVKNHVNLQTCFNGTEQI